MSKYKDENLSALTPRKKGEMHPPQRISKFPYLHTGNYMGPGTHTEERILKGDKPISYSDKVSQAHDLRYTLAKSPQDIRRADDIMIDRMKKGLSLDYPINLNIGLRGIQTKEFIEDKITKKPLVKYGNYNKNNEKILQDKLDELQREGYGKKPASLKNPWLIHVKKYMRQHPNMKFKDVLINAKKTY